MGSLGRAPVVRQIVYWVSTLREVYGAFDIDPTYHPQRNEDRLKEAQRVSHIGDQPCDASKGSADGTSEGDGRES
jgi:hypothetical protein